MADQRQRRDSRARPSPDALLEAAKREESRVGKLKIFVGAAPGVGKTYEMLQQARSRRKDGYDIVIGVVETHGRQETEALLEGLEVIPRKAIAYRGQSLDEMDIDAVLARRPQIVLVDELAHTNAAGSRHPKRYLDVEEILSNGIDVYTTVNIQHIESLNDVVAQITRVRVRETIPDTIFNRADAVELVDLTPDDLIARLKDGKIYVPKQAERALEHFFSPTNLTALRELALRRTADRVDEQLLTQMQAGAIQGPWAAGERILVCVNEHVGAAGLVRHAKRLSERLHAPFTALCIETRRTLQLSQEERDRVADTLRLAEALGGEAVTIPGAGRTIADDVISYAQSSNVTQILLGKSHALALVRDAARLGGARPGPQGRQHQRARRRRQRCRRRADPEEDGADGGSRGDAAGALCVRAAGSRRGAGDRPRGAAADARCRERRPDLPHGSAGGGGPLRARAVAAGERRRLAVLQLLLPAADL